MVSIAGGLGALALLPGASAYWTLLPQVLIGVGLGLTLAALTEAALEGRSPQALHGGYTIAARHLGVVIGLVPLTPVFTGDLGRQENAAKEAGTALLLDAPLPTGVKIELATRIVGRLDAAGNRVPDVAQAFPASESPDDPSQRATYDGLRDALTDQVERAATHAFSRSFWLAAALALLALVPFATARRVDL